jgi:hypothetical protein
MNNAIVQRSSSNPHPCLLSVIAASPAGMTEQVAAAFIGSVKRCSGAAVQRHILRRWLYFNIIQLGWA